MAGDPRRLGVATRRIAVFQDIRSRAMEAADEMLTDGFHASEPDSGLRWTKGEAELPAALFEDFEDPLELVLHVADTTCYTKRLMS